MTRASERLTGLPPLTALYPQPPTMGQPAPPNPSLATHTSGTTESLSSVPDQIVEWTPAPLQPGQQLGLPAAVLGLLPALEPGPTRGQYALGPATRPPIRHDNGFLQNPDDDTDPVPLPTRPATVDDYLQLAKWNTILGASELLRPGIVDAENGRFEVSGLGHQFTTRGEARRTLSWSRSDGLGVPASTVRAEGVRRHQGPRETRMGIGR